MAHVVVLATGGTIASTNRQGSGATATQAVSSLLAGIDAGGGEVIGVDFKQIGSYLLTHADMREIVEKVNELIEDPSVVGVVVTHGTDTLEETAFLCHLCIDSPKPVVFTGAQLTVDSLGYDGRRNLRDAIDVAGSDEARGAGTLVVFGGEIFSALGVRKSRTVAPVPFNLSAKVGSVFRGSVCLPTLPMRSPGLMLPSERFDSTRVDALVMYPSVDSSLAEASVAAGARGILLIGTGTGNANLQLLEWIRRQRKNNLAVGISTRADEGPVVPIYGRGGAADLVASGCLTFGNLPWSQARILMVYLLATGNALNQETIQKILTLKGNRYGEEN